MFFAEEVDFYFIVQYSVIMITPFSVKYFLHVLFFLFCKLVHKHDTAKKKTNCFTGEQIPKSGCSVRVFFLCVCVCVWVFYRFWPKLPENRDFFMLISSKFFQNMAAFSIFGSKKQKNKQKTKTLSKWGTSGRSGPENRPFFLGLIIIFIVLCN